MNDYAVFAIIENLEGGIPLVMEKGDFQEKNWKLPGGKKQGNESPGETLMREVYEEINLIVYEPNREILRKHIKKDNRFYDFIVMTTECYNGKIAVKNEIGRVELFSREEIRNMINKDSILPNHAEALKKYLVL